MGAAQRSGVASDEERDLCLLYRFVAFLLPLLAIAISTGTEGRARTGVFAVNAARPSPLWSINRLYYRMPVGYAGEEEVGGKRQGEGEELFQAAESRRSSYADLGWTNDQARAVLDNVRTHINSDYSYEEENEDEYENDDDEYEYEEHDRKGQLKKVNRDQHYYYGFTGNRIVPLLPPAPSPIPQTRPQTNQANPEGNSIEVDPNNQDINEYRYAFLLGVIPATLATLLLLGHTPLQLLLIGAYIVTVYILNFDTPELKTDSKKGGEANLWLSLLLEYLTATDSTESDDDKSVLQRNESPASSSLEQSVPFLELLRWLDKSALAPLLNEKTVELLYRVTNLAEALQK